MLKFRSVIILVGCISSMPALAQITQEQRAALQEIREFAKDLCNSVGVTGRASEWRVSAEGRAQVANVVKRFADLGFKGATEISDKKWEGVLQSDLASVLTIDSNCRLRVFEKLEAKLLSSAGAKRDASSAVCNFLSRDGICLGMSRAEFKSNPARSLSDWESEGQYLVTTLDYNAHGLDGNAWFYFLSEKLVRVIFQSSIKSWSRSLQRNIFAGATASSLKPKWTTEKEDGGGDDSQVIRLCDSLAEFRRNFNDKFGPPIRKPTREQTSLYNLMRTSSDYCKGDKCEIDESDKDVNKLLYTLGSGAIVEVSSIHTRASWNRYIGYDSALDMRTRNECTLSFKYEIG